ncbi:MAG: pyridoxal-phosphate dependent enzyme [Flavobacteriales bacterium]|nr:pyridoxal-phosphate dependent enzyme [Flavobacteriales bacterium]
MNNKEYWNIVCISTNEVLPIDAPIWNSSSGNLLQLNHGLVFTPDMIDIEEQGLWRYKAMLPVFSKEAVISFGEGMTPLVQTEINNKKITLKLEYLFPSGSYKDRGATVLISHMRECGWHKLVEDSSGNAGAAIATYAAKAGINSQIVVSENTSPTKIRQLEMLGAEVIKIAGNREDVAEEAKKRANNSYYASHCYNPFFFQGTKTFAYELWEQTGGNLPEEIFFPVGNGTLILGSFIGFMELLEAGLVEVLPRHTAVQAENCAALIHHDKEKLSATIAEGIAVKKPIRKPEILNAIRYTKGRIITVTEEEIISCWQKLASLGFYVEKTAAVGVAGWIKSDFSQKSLVPLTGHGLKNG